MESLLLLFFWGKLTNVNESIQFCPLWTQSNLFPTLHSDKTGINSENDSFVGLTYINTRRKIIIALLFISSFFLFFLFLDARYLLGFLRARKFSQLGARELLENYWTVRTKYSDWYDGVDSSDNRIQDIIKQGYVN